MSRKRMVDAGPFIAVCPQCAVDTFIRTPNELEVIRFIFEGREIILLKSIRDLLSPTTNIAELTTVVSTHPELIFGMQAGIFRSRPRTGEISHEHDTFPGQLLLLHLDDLVKAFNEKQRVRAYIDF